MKSATAAGWDSMVGQADGCCGRWVHDLPARDNKLRDGSVDRYLRESEFGWTDKTTTGGFLDRLRRHDVHPIVLSHGCLHGVCLR